MTKPQRLLVTTIIIGTALAQPAKTADIIASPAQGVTLTVYDTDMALVRELRRITLAAGENTVKFTGLPARLDPATISMSPPASVSGLQLLEQQFAYDLGDVASMLQRYLGQEVVVLTDKGREPGVLLSAPASAEELRAGKPLALRTADRATAVYIKPDRLQGVLFPKGKVEIFAEPTLLWRVKAATEGIKNARLNYAVDGLSWKAFYELVLNAGGRQGILTGRIALRNESGGSFSGARVRLVSTEKGAARAARWKKVDVTQTPSASRSALRYMYERENLTFEDWVISLAPVNTYDLPEKVSIEAGREKFINLFMVEELPVRRFYVYDGVKFDRFQRNRRNDWNYGTESHSVVEAHLEFTNEKAVGLGFGLVPGRFRLYRRRTEGVVDLLGEDYLNGADEGEPAHVRIGLARGLKGERERTGYSEVVPLHEYEETFEIRLENNSDEEAEIRVVEHLYRWRDFEIVRADTEYKQTNPQTIMFRPRLKPGGRRAIHYTVRYTW